MRRAAPVHRGRDIHEAHRVATPLELLFDLTFVVAIALAAAQLHHGLAEGHVGPVVVQFLMAFFAIWWAWMNYTWFASAYDNDDLAFRLLTMAQMVGVLIFAVGVPGIFEGEFAAGVLGYAIMRAALITQWLRAGQGDPERRTTCRRYALGLGVLQLFWIARLGCDPAWLLPTFCILAVGELLVPPWAERAGETPWHAHHIAERYGLLVIITLGECVLGAANAVTNLWRANAANPDVANWSPDLIIVGLGSMLLVLCLWWMYFLLPSGEALHHHRERGFAWGYGHFFVFASLAAMGAGLEVVADTLNPGVVTPGDAAPPFYAISMVALPMALFVFAVWALHRHVARAQDRQRRLLLACLVCIALVPAAVAGGLALPWALVLLSVGPVIAIASHERTRRQGPTLHVQ
ncbi:MAG: low temperature requirement protein A [Proteobacteria bacterium]|nr:low temperature requirement protein A [Pseudomonadota bacterium]